METIYWGTAALSLLAVWLNIHGRRVCFAIWAMTNATWAVVDYLHEIHAQAALQLAYLALSVYGLIKWRRSGREGRDGLEDPT